MAPAPLKETRSDIEEIDREFQRICSGLSYPPGSLFRIASQYLVNWGIDVTPENAAFIERMASESYLEEWKRGTKASNDAIEKATSNASLQFGNEELNHDVGIMAADLLSAMARYKDEILICDIGAGAGDTTAAVLTFLDIIDGAGDILKKCHFYLLEPSHSRLANAKESLESHSANAHCSVDFTLVTSCQEKHLRMLADGAFDMVISSAVFHHMTFTKHLMEIRQKMAADGVMVLGDWYTAIWKQPAFVTELLERLGMSPHLLEMFMHKFGVKKGDVSTALKTLEPYHIQSNRMMVDYGVAIADEFRKIAPNSRLYFLEGHETLEDRMLKLEKSGLETDFEELRGKHRAFVTSDGNIKNLFPQSDFATVIVAGKIPGHTPKAAPEEIRERIRKEILRQKR